jgi:5-methylcytosine-specific restriction endonuclease McrA
MGVLQLDVTMRPVDLISVEDAVAKIAGEAQAIASDENVLFRGPDPRRFDPYSTAERLVIPTPQIIQILTYVELKPQTTQAVVRRVLYARDNYECAYCSARLDRKSATIDHVKPLSRGGTHSWDNVVTACRPCNHKKADKLPMEARMLPKRTPKRPSYVQTAWAGRLELIQKEYVADYFRVAVELL